VSDTTVKIIASGTEIVGNKDDGYFIFKEIKGDFEISLRAHGLAPGNLQTIAGFMARQDLSDNAKHISFCIFPDNQKRNNTYKGCVMLRRLKKGDNVETIYPNPQTDENKLDVIFPKTWIKSDKKSWRTWNK